MNTPTRITTDRSIGLRRRALLGAPLAGLLVWPRINAQTTEGTIRFVVPFAAGGGSDATARLMQPALSTHFGAPVFIDNKPGANTTMAAALLTKAPADGSNFMIVTIAHSVNGSLYTQLPYNTKTDFTPISMVTSAPMVLVVSPKVPAKNIRELIALAKARPGKLNYASPGSGSPAHLAGELFKKMAGVDIVHIPYKAASQAITDIIGGQIEITFSSMGVIQPFIQAGQVRALSVTTERRASGLPEVPTMAEAGVPGYSFTSWQAIIGPAKMSKDAVAKLNRGIVTVLNEGAVRDKLTALGYEVTPTTPEATTAFLNSEIERYSRVVKAIGAKVD